MKKGWQTKHLSEVAAISAGNPAPQAEALFKDGTYPFFRTADAGRVRFGDIYEAVDYLNEEGARGLRRYPIGTILFPKSGASTFLNHRVMLGVDGYVSSHLATIVADETKVEPRFLLYFLSTVVAQDLVQDHAYPSLNLPTVAGIKIQVPSLPEQRRIVGILDEAFEGIATAKANAEKNIQNARAIFESHLQSVFTERGEGWVERKLGEVCAITSILVDPRKKEFLDLTHVGAGNIESKTGVFVDLKTAREEGLISGKFLFDDSMVLYSKIRPYLMKVARPDFSGLCSADMYPLAPFPKEIMRDYLFHLLLSKPFTDYAVLGSARAGMPKVNREHLFEFKMWLPDLKKQDQIAANLDELHAETQRLESLYQLKLTALDNLKKSLLHQAFTGQLTAGQSAQVRSTVIPFPVTVPNISATDLHAGVLAMAFEQHRKNGKETYFTHVKAEKIAHMVEAHLGLDLGRAPVKDAAGPNDFPHLIKVEHRARMANYFDFKQVGAAYRVRKLRDFERLIDKTRIALGDRREEVEDLLQWMLPMTVRQAEIAATVFAAWNNLLLDGQHPTDEQIVFEARENWHPDKLKIDRQKFLVAVQWLRKQGRAPEGKGRRVAAKGN